MARLKSPPVHDDAKMVSTPDNWPSWPYLPVKRKDNSLEKDNLGVLLATQEHQDAVLKKAGSKFTIFHVYMFAPPKNKEEWDAAKKSEYTSLESLLSDGWIVD